MSRAVSIVCLLLCLVDMGLAQAADIVTHPSNHEGSVSRSTIRAMFGMRLLTWPNGRPVRVFVLPDHHPVHVAFAKETLGLFPYQLRQTWDRLVFSGVGQAPEEVANEEEMIARVASTPGAIGYVRRSRGDAVRVLTLD